MSDQSVPADKPHRGRPTLLSRPMTAAERQARVRDWRRARTSQELLAEVPGERIYTDGELVILEEIRDLRGRLQERAGCLNALLLARMSAAAENPDLKTLDRRRAQAAIAELEKTWRLTLPNF